MKQITPGYSSLDFKLVQFTVVNGNFIPSSSGSGTVQAGNLWGGSYVLNCVTCNANSPTTCLTGTELQGWEAGGEDIIDDEETYFDVVLLAEVEPYSYYTGVVTLYYHRFVMETGTKGIMPS